MSKLSVKVITQPAAYILTDWVYKKLVTGTTDGETEQYISRRIHHMAISAASET